MLGMLTPAGSLDSGVAGNAGSSCDDELVTGPVGAAVTRLSDSEEKKYTRLASV